MSLPRFLDRVVDATAPLLGGLDREAVRAKLERSSVTLVGGDRAVDGTAHAGFLLAANLAARLYPRICLRGPPELVHAAEGEIILINPADSAISGTLQFVGTDIPNMGYSVAAGGAVKLETPATTPTPSPGTSATRA